MCGVHVRICLRVYGSCRELYTFPFSSEYMYATTQELLSVAHESVKEDEEVGPNSVSEARAYDQY